MEEVVSSNLTRSTKTFQRLSVSPPSQDDPTESNRSPNFGRRPAAPENQVEKRLRFHGTSPLCEKSDISDKCNLSC